MRSRSWAWSTLYQTREPHAYKSFELLTTGSKTKTKLDRHCDIPSTRKKLFSKYAQIIWSESYFIGRLHDVLHLFNNCLKRNFNPNSPTPPPPLTKNKIKIAILIQYGRKKGTKIDNLFYKIEEKKFNCPEQNKPFYVIGLVVMYRYSIVS